MFEFVKVNPTNGRSFPLKAFFTGVLRFGAVPNAVGSSESNSSKFDVSSTPLIVGTYGGWSGDDKEISLFDKPAAFASLRFVRNNYKLYFKFLVHFTEKHDPLF